MPQPLSSVESNGHVILGAKLVCREFPDLVVRVAHTIALATLIETLAIELLTSMSGSHGKPAAMVGSWPSLKRSVNKAVSNAIAEQDDQDLFNAVLALPIGFGPSWPRTLGNAGSDPCCLSIPRRFWGIRQNHWGSLPMRAEPFMRASIKAPFLSTESQT
jgi:hypothetical protein